MKIPAWVPEGTEVDEKTYGKDLDMTDVSQITAAQATGHLINFFNNCKEEKWRDKKLWIELREDFDGWNVKLWELVDKNIRAKFRDHIRDHGVYVKRDAKSVSKHLQAVLDEEKYHEWTSAEVEEQLEHGQFYSKWNPAPSALVTAYTQPLPGGFPNAFGGYAPTSALFGAYAPWVPQLTNLPPWAQQYGAQQYGAPPLPPPNGASIAGNIQTVITNPEEPIWTREEIQKQMSNKPETNLFSNEGNFNSKRNPNRKCNTTHLPPIPPGGNDGGRKGGDLDIPTIPIIPQLPTDQIPSRKVTNLMKIYQEEETETFYYNTGKRYDFDTMLRLTRTHFETDENRQLYMSEWRETTFQRAINSTN